MIKKIRNIKGKVTTKMTFMFMFLGILVLIAAMVTLNVMRRTNEEYSENYTEFGASLSDLGAAGYYYKTATGLIREMMLYQTLGFGTDIMTELKVTYDGAIKTADTYLTAFKSEMHDETILAEYDELYKAFTDYKEVTAKAVGYFITGDDEAATLLLQSDETAAIEAAMSKNISLLFNDARTAGQDANIKAERDSNTRMNLIMIIFIFFGIMLIATAEIIKKAISIPVKQIGEAAVKIASGDVEVEIERDCQDEFGDLQERIAEMIANIRYQAEVAKNLSSGDLTQDVKTKGDHDVLGNALKQVVDDNNSALSGIREATEQVSIGSNQVAGASQSLAQGSTEQASAIEEITAAIEDITVKTKKNASDANEANRMVNTAKDSAVEGNDRMKEMRTAMSEINESSENISKIIKVIDNIAFQTNILALNASVEAARAGAHGKGFAVVAEEVRNLAGKSAQAASETAYLIEDSIMKVTNGSKLAEETATSLAEIVSQIEAIVHLIEDIAVASNDQATAIVQIDQAITQVSQVVQTNSATSEQCAAAAEELSAQSVKLKEMLSVYRLKTDRFGAATEESKRKTGTQGQGRNERIPRLTGSNETIISLEEGYGKY